MLAAVGLKSQEDLLSYIPEEIRFNGRLPIEDGKSEYDIVEYFKQRGLRSALGYPSFLGAGVYNHYRPVIVDTVVSRGEFVTS